MQVSSTKMPRSPAEIVRDGEQCTISLFDNVTSHEETDSQTGQPVTIWNYELYTVTAAYRANLMADIEENLEVWLQRGRGVEYDREGGKVRAYRDKLLNDCDVTHCNAANWALMDEAKRLEWQEYKQALRDISEQEDFPLSVSWPVAPLEVF